MDLWQLRPVIILMITPIAAALILVSGRRPNLREGWTMGAAILQAILVLSMVPDVIAGETFELELVPLATGFHLYLRTDAFGMVFACVASILWVPTSVYSIGYMRQLNEHHQTPYFASFAMCLCATMGLSFAGNPLTFLVFYEVLTIATYPLVIHKRTDKAIITGRKYLAYTLTAGLCMLLAIGWAHQLVPAHDFRAGGFLSLADADPLSLTMIFILFMAGVGVKAGIMPLHAWLPAAMIAPTPVSALLHAVAVVKAGVFGALRVCGFIFGFGTLKSLGLQLPLATLAAFTILTASIMAMSQDHLKRRLAYSTISQLSYIILGVALMTQASITGAVMHIVNHAFMKITLFMCAGTIYAHLHIENISEMKGIGRSMPLTMTAFGIGAFGLAGLPPFPGFVSKWWLGMGALQAEERIFVAVLVGSALLNIVYLWPIFFQAFFKKNERFSEYNEARPALVGPLLFTATASIVLGLMPNIGPHFWDFAGRVAHSVIFVGLPS